MAFGSNFTVDAASRKIGHTIKETVAAGDGNETVERFVPLKSISDLGVNTSEMEYRDWMVAVFKHDPVITIYTLVPLLSLAAAGIYYAFIATGQLFTMLPAVALVFIIAYNILARISTSKVHIIRKDKDSGEFFQTEDEFWTSDVRAFPKEAYDLDQESGSWVPWLDCRDGDNVKVLEWFESPQDFADDNVNASDVMGTESYLRTTYNIGNMRAKRSFIEENMPSLTITFVGLGAAYFAADRIAQMLQLHP